MPIVVVAAHRPVDAAGALALSESIAELQHHGLVLELRGLDVDGTTALVSAVRGQPVPGAAAHSVWEITGGNPLFTRELARALPASALDRAIDVSELAIPATLRALVADRRSGRSARGVRRSSMCLASLAIRRSSGFWPRFAIVRPKRCSTSSTRRRTAGLAELHANAVSYRHALFRVAVYESLSSATRARLHDRVGHELEARRRRGLPVDVGCARSSLWSCGAAGQCRASVQLRVGGGRRGRVAALVRRGRPALRAGACHARHRSGVGRPARGEARAGRCPGGGG